MHVLLTIPSLLKSWGGPAAVVQGFGEQLVRLDTAVSVLTIEPDLKQPEALPRDHRVKIIHVPASACGLLGGGLQNALVAFLTDNSIDIVHDFGLWHPANHAVAAACHRMNIPRVSSPSGTLADWAFRHKAWKKRPAWWLYQRQDLRRASMLAATSEQELDDIRLKVPESDIALIPNGVEIPAVTPDAAPLSGDRVRKVVFLGRIHSVKGLRNLLEAWSVVNPENWRCILAGPDEAGHQKELAELLKNLNLVEKFEFPGLVEGERKWELLRNADVFVLPSFSENFGISAAEALACGVPVITTKGAPWKIIDERQCGWWVDIGVEPLANALRAATSLSDEQRREMGLRGRKLVEDNYSWSLVSRKMLAVYNWVLGHGSKPEFVF